MKKVLVMVAMVSFLFFGGCTSEALTIETLQKAGYDNIQPQGYAFFACGEEDTFQTNFIATNPAGNEVSGVVCCGLIFKSCTIRF